MRNDTIEELCVFFGISFENPIFERAFNVSRTDTVIGEPLRREIHDHYAKIYRFAGERFGADWIADFWHSH